jgi:AbrB family looped-hinge helix DNA binding protein
MGSNAPISALTSKCQTTIPKEVRKHLGIGPGDRVKWFILSDGQALLLPIVPVTALRGILKAKKQVSLAEMEAGMAEGATARYRRYLRQR